MAEPANRPAVDIEVLFIRDCPNHRPLVDMVERVALELGLSAKVCEHEIQTEDEAARRGFIGSPTILVNGRDVSPDDGRDAPPSLSCRLYGGKGLPPYELVETALSAAAAGSGPKSARLRPRPAAGGLAAFGSAGSAVFASACCWLPLMFAGLGVSVAPIASVFDAVRPYMLVLGGAASAAAMYLAFRPARLTAEDCGCGPARPNWFGRSMALATVFAVVTAAAFPQLVAAYSRASREPAPVVDESPGVQRIEFPIRGMTCAGCAAGVEDALQRLREVSRARVSYERRSAVVWLIPGVEDSFTLEAKIADTIERAGFKAQIAHPSGQ